MAARPTAAPIPEPQCFPPTVAPCPACAGRGCQPSGDGRLDPCGPCRGSGIPAVVGDLGGTRSCPKGRPFEYDPTTREALVSRGSKVTRYLLAPFAAQWDQPGRAVRVTNLDTLGHPVEVRNVFLDRDGRHSCDCEGACYEATGRADFRARQRGEGPVGRSTVCTHVDLCLTLDAGGWLDVTHLQPKPAPQPAGEPAPTPAPKPTLDIRRCDGCGGFTPERECPICGTGVGDRRPAARTA